MWQLVTFTWCRSSLSRYNPTPRLSYRWHWLTITLRLRPVRYTPCSALRTASRVTIGCIVPSSHRPIASGCSPTISRPSIIGLRCRCQTLSLTLFGSAVPPCVPMNFSAGPGPAITIVAVPSPTTDVVPTRSRSMTIGCVMR